MSKVDKLSILGVRSFDNQRSETIQFYSPLTLIVGHNGSGKTTIIECLKYATTGELPPNSRGGAFIHDPKLCGEKEVLAQVRFSFLSTTQARMVATRNLQLTVKKTTRSQKTLEGSLLMVKDGERTAISSRVAELDQILPQYLGVSTAILDNVIFCHQDESLWPMSEPSVLKKKFDEIFEAMKYTKAIDNIKQLRKKQNEELGKYKLIEQHAKENKDRADKAEKKMSELSDEIESLRADREALHEKAVAVGKKAADSWDSAARFTEILNSLESAREKKKWHETQRDKLLADFEERSEPDDWLRSELEQSEEREEAQKRAQAERAKHYEAVRGEIERTRGIQSTKRVEVGRLEQQRASHEAKIDEREAAIKTAARAHNIRGYDAELDDMQIHEFMDRLGRLSKEMTAHFDRTTRENGLGLQKIQEVINELLERRSTLLESKKTARDLIFANEQKIKAAHSDMEKLNVDEASRANIEANILELTSQLEMARKRLASNDVNDNIRALTKELQNLDIEISTLNRDLVESTKHAGELARLDHLRKEVNDRQRSLETLRMTYSERLQGLIERDLDFASLETDFQTMIEAKKKDVLDAERDRDITARQLEQIEYKMKLARSDLMKKRDELAASSRIVKEKSDADPEDYPETLEGAEQDRDTIKSDVENFINLNKYFQQAIEAVSEHRVCRLCRRRFDEEKAAKQFLENLKESLSLKKQEQSQAHLKELEASLQRCREAGTSYDIWKRISEKDLPNLEADISKLESERGKVLENLETQDRTVKDKEDARREAETLSKPVSSIVRCKSELENYQGQIKALAGKQDSSIHAQSLDSLHEQLESLNEKAKDRRQKLSKLQAEERTFRDKVSSLEIELGSGKAQLVTADHELEKKARITSQIDEARGSTQAQRDIITSLDQQLPELGARMSEETKRLDEVKSKNREQESQLQRDARALMDTLRELERLHKEVKKYDDEGGPALLARSLREIASFDQQIEAHEAEAKQITIQINELREEIDKKDRNRRTIIDNLNYRQTTRDLAALDEEIQRYVAQNAEADQEYHHRNAERFRKDHQELLAQETSKFERMKVRDDQLMQLLADWKTDFKDAAPAYKKAHIEVETTKAAVDDLGRYGGALDKAIMTYHSIKMEEINRIIEELWRRTYQGTDVDTILIRSDNETAKGNRSYNYRVCMVKQDAEMDMRGRCSAGQKVLASIIIRLALAECFGVNCGLIALDEPTTNLDRDNICSLAESLHHIIRQRRQQHNFQLIVITHDEDFLRHINPAEFCDHYYRVSRNDRQKSIIERQSIAEVL